METVVGLWLLVVGDVDRRSGRLPIPVLWPGVAAVAAQSAARLGASDPRLVAAALVATLPYLLAHALGQVGGGDVKLAFVVGGLAVDPAVAVLAVVTAQLVGVWGSARSARRRRPHGPALAGVAAALVLGGG
ncbi:prepilin peptidase [Gordonia sp. X0973]|uniref:prepilin peptidase n=1 Tax=Gordonia sp. X0973 TaxID=2742602 RepID=UPI000F53912F|nr:prepilin peptidase [Gordonia sp. X0973]QKT07269.1 prepilin peptidase [Gordonia sp. X0973]